MDIKTEEQLMINMKRDVYKTYFEELCAEQIDDALKFLKKKMLNLFNQEEIKYLTLSLYTVEPSHKNKRRKRLFRFILDHINIGDREPKDSIENLL